jgi:hypothetical protein
MENCGFGYFVYCVNCLDFVVKIWVTKMLNTGSCSSFNLCGLLRNNMKEEEKKKLIDFSF